MSGDLIINIYISIVTYNMHGLLYGAGFGTGPRLFSESDCITISTTNRFQVSLKVDTRAYEHLSTPSI